MLLTTSEKPGVQEETGLEEQIRSGFEKKNGLWEIQGKMVYNFALRKSLILN
jgi:hypothetical protein